MDFLLNMHSYHDINIITHKYIIISFLSWSFAFSFVLLHENLGHAPTLFFTLLRHMLRHENFGHAFTYSPFSTWNGNELILWPSPHFFPLNFNGRGGSLLGHLPLSKNHTLNSFYLWLMHMDILLFFSFSYLIENFMICITKCKVHNFIENPTV